MRRRVELYIQAGLFAQAAQEAHELGQDPLDYLSDLLELALAGTAMLEAKSWAEREGIRRQFQAWGLDPDMLRAEVEK